MTIGAAIIGSGNIGTDLMVRTMRRSSVLNVVAMAGVDASSEGLARARRWGVATTDRGIDGLVRLPQFEDVAIVFDATTAAAHAVHAEILRRLGRRVIDLTPAALGPYVVPTVNLDAMSDAPDVNMVTCGGQATVPIVAAISRVANVHYAEIVASIASKSAGPGTRANVDEFTDTTAKAIESVGGAQRGKAIIVLNPAEPPLLMRNTVFAFCEDANEGALDASIRTMVAAVQEYVPGYRLKQTVQLERLSSGCPVRIPGCGSFHGVKVSVFLEVEGAGHFLPKYAGNLDIMTSAALATAERLAQPASNAIGRAPSRSAERRAAQARA